MKILRNISWKLALLAMTVISSCKQEEFTLDALPDKSEVKFEIIQDLSIDPGGNTVILVNKTPGTVAIWDYAIGKSNKDRDTVRYAFQGDYTIKFAVMTGGGLVEMDPKVIKVSKNELKYVDDPLWSLLTGGGVGHEKTWVLDVNANGDKKVFTSPVYFAGTQVAYGSLAADGSSVAWKQECPAGGTNCWTYAPVYTSDTWAADKKDHGTMTFSLKGGANLSVNHMGIAGLGTETGTFFLDSKNLTLNTTNASVLGVAFTPSDVANLYSWKIISLTENTMQLAGKHKTKDEVQVLNFLSKSFSDAWVPTEQPVVVDAGFNPKFAAGELVNFLTGSASRVWTLDVDGNPVDWLAKGKGWTVNKGSSFDWGWNATWETAIANSYIRFEKTNMTYTRFQNGVKTTGTFSVNAATNEVTLTNGTLLQNPGHWMSTTATTLKVVKAFPGDITKGIWFGTSYDAQKDEWFAFHYVLL